MKNFGQKAHMNPIWPIIQAGLQMWNGMSHTKLFKNKFDKVRISIFILAG